ncbi:hypothetical protein GW17_00050791 [Ensete ventricosum]|nr:hypothetical protein GW17_00050791 [Ensete ventricosum]
MYFLSFLFSLYHVTIVSTMRKSRGRPKISLFEIINNNDLNTLFFKKEIMSCY